MNVLIDTNIVLDIMLERMPRYEDSARISLLAEHGYIQTHMSATAVTDVYYLAGKSLKDKKRVLELLKRFLKYTRVIATTEDDIYRALELGWDDFEDSVQYIAAQSADMDCIVTWNTKDYLLSLIEVFTPCGFVKRFVS